MEFEDARRARAPGYAWYALGVLLLVYVLNFLDRQILSILAQDIKADLRLTDAQLGFLYGTAFAIFYALFSIPLARLADTWLRGRLIAIGIALWSLMTAASGLATGYPMLAATRTLVGVGEAGASPAAFSMLANYFPVRQRALAASIYSAGVYIGGGISLPLGGWISSRWDQSFPVRPLGLHGWQASFIAIGLPGLLLALWVWSLREPARGPAALAQPRSGDEAWRAFATDLLAIVPPLSLIAIARYPGELTRNLGVASLVALIAAGLIWVTGDIAQWVALAIGTQAIYTWTRSLRHTDLPAWTLICGSPVTMMAICAIGMTSFVIYSFSFWSTPFAIRSYGVSKETIGLTVGLPGAATSTLGAIFGGWLSDAWKARDPRGRAFVMMLCLALSAPAMAAMYVAPDFAQYRTIAPLTYFVSALWAGSAVTMIQDLVLPRMRATAGAAYLLGSTMIGLALGPYFTGKLAEITGSLREALLLGLATIPLTLLILYAISRCMAAVEADRFTRAGEAGQSS